MKKKSQNLFLLERIFDLIRWLNKSSLYLTSLCLIQFCIYVRDELPKVVLFKGVLPAGDLKWQEIQNVNRGGINSAQFILFSEILLVLFNFCL